MNINDNFLIKNLSYLLYCLPFFLITGPFLPDLSLVISIILTLYLIFKKKLFFYFNNYFFILFIIWCLYLILRSLLSVNPLLSLESSLFYFRFGFFAVVIWFITNNNINFRKYFFYSLLLAYCLLILHAYIDFFFDFNFLYLQEDGPRMSGLFGDKLILGSYLSRTFPIFFALSIFLYKKNKKMIYLIFFIFFLTDVLIYLSGERVAFFNLILFTFIVVFMSKEWILFRSVTIFFSIVVILSFSIFTPEVKERMISVTAKQMGYETDNKYIFSYEHQSLFSSAFNIFLDNKLFGVGPKLFRQICTEPKYFVHNYCSSHPHNLYIQLMSEIGLIGLIPILAIYIYISFLFFKHIFLKFFKRKFFLTDYKIYLFSSLIVNFFPFIPSGNFFNNWLCVIFFLPIGFLLQNYYDNKLNNISIR